MDNAPFGVTSRGRLCEHPHSTLADNERLLEIEPAPHPPGQLFLLTEVGWVAYSGFDNARACAASGQLGRRHLAAGTCLEFALVQDNVKEWNGGPVPRYTDPQFARPQMTLAWALAEAEGRYCVADSVLDRMVCRG